MYYHFILCRSTKAIWDDTYYPICILFCFRAWKRTVLVWSENWYVRCWMILHPAINVYIELPFCQLIIDNTTKKKKNISQEFTHVIRKYKDQSHDKEIYVSHLVRFMAEITSSDRNEMCIVCMRFLQVLCRANDGLGPKLWAKIKTPCYNLFIAHSNMLRHVNK